MARPNSNQDRTGGQPATPHRAAPVVDHGLPWNQGQQAAPPAYEPQFAPPGFDAHAGARAPQSAQPGQLPWPQPAPASQHGYPQQQPAYPPQAAPFPPGFPADPHQGHYFPPGPSGAAYPPAAPYGEPATNPRGAFPGQADYHNASEAPYGGAPHQGYASPYAQQPLPNAGYPAHDGRAADPRGYEFGAYATMPGAQQGYLDPATARAPAAPPPPGFADFGQPLGARPGQPSFEPQYAEARGGGAHLDELDEEEFDDEEADYEDEDLEPKRRFGFVKVVASLAVAVAIGAGGAYGYKKFGTGLSANYKPIVVRADAAPVKVRPAGEAQNLAADAKSGERLGEPVPAVVPANTAPMEEAAPAGARRVQTIAIAPPGAAQQPTAPMRPTISVPGLAVDGMMASTPPAQQSASLPPVTPAPVGRAVAPPPVVAQTAPIAPRVIAAIETPPEAEVPQARAPKVPVAKANGPKATKVNDAYSPAGPAPATRVATATTAVAPTAKPKAATNGYVAVLASQSSAVDARKTLDDLQGKYSSILGSKPTDVAEFDNPKDGKTYYRAIVGPPGSREAAANVCAQVRAAGHKDCFATAY